MEYLAGYVKVVLYLSLIVDRSIYQKDFGRIQIHMVVRYAYGRIFYIGACTSCIILGCVKQALLTTVRIKEVLL